MTNSLKTADRRGLAASTVLVYGCGGRCVGFRRAAGDGVRCMAAADPDSACPAVPPAAFCYTAGRAAACCCFSRNTGAGIAADVSARFHRPPAAAVAVLRGGVQQLRRRQRNGAKHRPPAGGSILPPLRRWSLVRAELVAYGTMFAVRVLPAGLSADFAAGGSGVVAAGLFLALFCLRESLLQRVSGPGIPAAAAAALTALIAGVLLSLLRLIWPVFPDEWLPAAAAFITAVAALFWLYKPDIADGVWMAAAAFTVGSPAVRPALWPALLAACRRGDSVCRRLPVRGHLVSAGQQRPAGSLPQCAGTADHCRCAMAGLGGAVKNPCGSFAAGIF